MKNLFYLLLTILFLGVSSCKKEDIKPNVQEEQAVEQIRIYGKWLLVDGYMYMTNLETGQKTKYSHFGPGKTTSSLDYDGADIPFESIEINETTWSFYEPPSVPGYGEFVLNGNMQTPYGFYVTKHNWTIMEHPQSTSSNMQMGGSTRPIRGELVSYSDSTVNFYVQEGYVSINNQNYSYISELTFKKIESW